MYICVIQKQCKKHGLTPFSNSKRPRCNKCMVEAVTKRRRKVKELSIEYLGGKCSKCGYDKCNAALDFHHLDTTNKLFSIGSKGYTRSWNIIKQELDKCILVCANCHRELHHTKN